MMNIRFYALTMAALILLGLSGKQAFAQNLKLLVDRQSGSFTLTGTDSAPVNVAGYVIESARSTLVDANFNGLRDTEADWVLAGIPGSDVVQELNSNGDPSAGAAIDDTLNFDLGSGVYNPAPVVATLPLGEDVEQNDLSLTYYNQVLDQFGAGVIEFTGEKIFNDIGITVDLADGHAYLENESPNDLAITGYLIESIGGGTLNANSGTFQGIGGDFQAPTTLDGDSVGELDPTGTGSLLTSSSAPGTLGDDLGVVADASSLFNAFEDLTFSFILAGMGEVSQVGFVKYINVPPGVPGDYNEDNKVDAADYVVWRDHLGAAAGALPNDPHVTAIGQDQYDTWKASFGSTAGTGSLATGAAAVPEPASLILALLGWTATAGWTMRNR